MTTLDSPKKKETVRISKKDLLKLLSDNAHQAKQITELQGRMNKMQEEIRALRTQDVQEPNPPPSEDFAPTELPKITVKELTPKDIEDIREKLKPIRNSRRGFYPRSDIYFDGK